MKYIANGRIYDVNRLTKQRVETVGENAYRYADDLRIDEHARYEKRTYISSLQSSSQYNTTILANTTQTLTTTYYTYTATYSRTTRSNTYLYNTGTRTTSARGSTSKLSYTLDRKFSERRSSTIPGMLTTSVTRTYWNDLGNTTGTRSEASPNTLITYDLTASYASQRYTSTSTGPYGKISYTVSQSQSKLIKSSKLSTGTLSYRITQTTSSYRTTYYSRTYTSTYTPYYSSRSQTYTNATTTSQNTTSSSSSSTTTTTKPGIYNQ